MGGQGKNKIVRENERKKKVANGGKSESKRKGKKRSKARLGIQTRQNEEGPKTKGELGQSLL